MSFPVGACCPIPNLARRTPAIPPEISENTATLSKLLGALRHQAEATGDWRAVIDGLRPHSQALWQGLSMEERSRFLRHALPWWNIHRHRIAPSVFARFEDLLNAGTVTIHAGFVESAEESAHHLAVTYRRRGSERRTSVDVDWIVNSTGMERAGIDHSPLLQEMARRGLIHQDPLGLGILTDKTSRTIGGNGGEGASLFAVGALTAGQFWEITAVPDIRTQAVEVVKRIAETISQDA